MIEHPPSEEPAAQDAHLRLLSLIEQHPDYSQRRLAEALGVSLGKAHYLLMALLDKGLVKAGRLTRNPAKFVYAVTPAGIRHRLQLTRRFLHLKEQEYQSLKAEIDQLRAVLDAESMHAADAVSHVSHPPDPAA
jgi:EPS-associated MarR family transcriptional regulator